MSDINGVIKGLQILERNQEPGDFYYNHIWAEHDIIGGGLKPERDSPDGLKLRELGWFWSTEFDCWSCFV